MTISDDIKSVEKQAGIWLGTHHIVLYALLAATLLTCVYLVESKLASVAEAKAEAAQTALAVEKDHSAQMLATLKQAQDALAQAQAQRDKDNAASQVKIDTLITQLKIQIAKDRVLPAPELAHRIEAITGFKQNTITLDPLQNLIVPLPLGQEIAVRLDQGLADAEIVLQQAKVIINQTATIADQTGIITKQTGVIEEDKKVLAAQIDTDAKVLKAEKAKARKSKLKWFGAGVVFGFIGRNLVKL